MPTLILTRKGISGLLSMKEIIPEVEQAFRDWTENRGSMPAKSYLIVDEGDFRAMPASLPGAAGIKWVNVHTRNPAKGLPTVMAVIIFNDPATGYPLAILDGTDVTAYRTGATAAIASKYMARPESKTLGVVGEGRQAYTQILAHVELFKFTEIRAYDILPQAVERLSRSLPNLPIKPATLPEAVRCDIVCTVTPARAPIVKKEWVLPGTHINAIGADAEGKEELEPGVLNMATVVVDDFRQASHAGEINVPISRGLFRAGDVYANLGEIILGHKKGRASADQVTIFDSTGVAIEDVAVASNLYRLAKDRGIGTVVDLVGV